MIVLLFSVIAGLAALARGILFTAAVCLVLLGSVFVLYTSQRIARTFGGPEWIPGALAILAFVLVIGGPAYLLATRDGSSRGTVASDDHTNDHTSDDHPTGDRPTDDAAGDPGQAVDDGATTGLGSPDDQGDLPDSGNEDRDGISSDVDRDDVPNDDRGDVPNDDRNDVPDDEESLGTPGG